MSAWRPAGLTGALRLAMAATSRTRLGRAAPRAVTPPATTVIGPARSPWPAVEPWPSARTHRPPRPGSGPREPHAIQDRQPSPVTPDAARPRASWPSRPARGPSGAAAWPGDQAGAARMMPRPVSRTGPGAGDSSGGPPPWPAGVRAAPATPQVRRSTVPTAAVTSGQARGPALDTAPDLAVSRREPEPARPGTGLLRHGLLDAVTAPVILPGLVVRPVPAERGQRADDDRMTGSAAVPVSQPAVPAGLPVRPAGQPAGPAARPAGPDHPPRPDEQDRPWPRRDHGERPASAAPRQPDIDAIAERVIGKLRRQQRLDRERRG